VPVPDQLYYFGTGLPRLFDTDPATGAVLGTHHDLDPNRYIIHRGHLLPVADNWGGPMRSILFYWLLKTQDREWWATFLSRYGAPFPVGKYPPGDEGARSIFQNAFSMATRIWGLVISDETEVQLIQAATSGSNEGYERFLELCNKEMSKVIIGTVAGAERATGSLGNEGRSRNQEAVRQDLRAFDARKLGETLRDQLFAQFLIINGLPGRAPRAIWGSVSTEEASAIGTLLKDITQGGLEVADDALPVISERIGFTIQRSTTSGSGVELAALAAALSLPPRTSHTDEAARAIDLATALPLSRAFRGAYAPIRRIIESSSSKEEAEQKIRALYPDFCQGKVSDLLAQALTAYSLNART
jgi:phage gp29-like protein